MSEEKIIRRGRRVNYLNNKDILKEIHKSKKSYCWYENQDTDSDYDIIVESVKKINKTRIKEAKIAKADRIKKDTGEVVDIKDIADDDIVFRVMTKEHI